MLKPHPSLLLRALVDERLYNEDLVKSLKRTYSYAATMIVEPCEPVLEDDGEDLLDEVEQAEQTGQVGEGLSETPLAALDAETMAPSADGIDEVPPTNEGGVMPEETAADDAAVEDADDAGIADAEAEDDSSTDGEANEDEIAPPGVCPVPDAQNTLVYEVRLHRPYWDANDPVAAEQWDAVMPRWLRNMFYKVSSTQTGYNTMCGEHGSYPLRFATTEIRFGDNCTFAFDTAEDWVLGEPQAQIIEQVRAAICAGELGQDVKRVSVAADGTWQVD